MKYLFFVVKDIQDLSQEAEAGKEKEEEKNIEIEIGMQAGITRETEIVTGTGIETGTEIKMNVLGEMKDQDLKDEGIFTSFLFT